jgi:hypothetical protein
VGFFFDADALFFAGGMAKGMRDLGALRGFMRGSAARSSSVQAGGRNLETS